MNLETGATQPVQPDWFTLSIKSLPKFCGEAQFGAKKGRRPPALAPKSRAASQPLPSSKGGLSTIAVPSSACKAATEVLLSSALERLKRGVERILLLRTSSLAVDNESAALLYLTLEVRLDSLCYWHRLEAQE